MLTTVPTGLVAEEDISPVKASGCGRIGSFAGVSESTKVAVVPGITIDIVKSMAAGVANAVDVRGRVQECESVSGDDHKRMAVGEEVCAILFGGGGGGGAYWRTVREDVEFDVSALTM